MHEFDQMTQSPVPGFRTPSDRQTGKILLHAHPHVVDCNQLSIGPAVKEIREVALTSIWIDKHGGIVLCLFTQTIMNCQRDIT